MVEVQLVNAAVVRWYRRVMSKVRQEKRRVALVTGCSGDIGQAVCAQLADAGMVVVGWDHTRPKDGTVDSWAEEDLAAGEVSAEAVQQLSAMGTLCHVFHIVGGADIEELSAPDPATVPLEVFRRTVAVNLFSAYAVVRVTVDLLRADPEGDRSLTFVSATNALGGYGIPGYSAAKSALHGLVYALAVPLARTGIRINAVALGTTQTANATRLNHAMGRSTDFEAIGAQTPRGRVLSANEAATALIAVGVNNPAVSGQVLVADAAQHIRRT
jgi:NAD(P)-dependent dehydrogenase (short-subunit alcohol dehydrogenase family)